MSEIFLDTAIALIEKKPVKYGITLVQFTPSSFDPTLRIPVAYRFRPITHGGDEPDGNLNIRVSDDVFKGEPKIRSAAHRPIIRFAFNELNSHYLSRDVDLDSQRLNLFLNDNKYSGPALRDMVLDFVYRVCSIDPYQSISWPNILENLNATEDEVQKWLRYWTDEGSLKRANNSIRYERDGFSTQGYILNPTKLSDVETYLRISPDRPTNDKTTYKHFMIIPIEPDGIRDGFVFYMTEFAGDSLALFEQQIREYCERELGLHVVISKQDRLPNHIDHKVISHIHKCRFAIADISTRNPNVMYEIGFAHAINKDVVIICDSKFKDKEVFDIRNIDTIYFQEPKDLIDSLSERIHALKKRGELWRNNP